jgi:DNA invertase Pin-like site-specific DNA recombinase
VTASSDSQVPCIVYAAKSSDDPHESIPDQIKDCLREIDRAGSRRLYADPLQDEKRSAFKGNRGRGLAAAIALAEKAASDHGEAELWVQHSDRLARGEGRKGTARHLGKLFFDLKWAGVEIRSVQDDDNLRDAIRAVLIGERNFEDSRRKSQAVRSGVLRAARRGTIPGGKPPRGYRRVVTLDKCGDPSATWHVDEGYAPTVRQVFALADQDMSAGQVMRALNRTHHEAPDGGAFSRRAVQAILTNPRYAGRVRRDPDTGEWLEGGWSALIDPEQWDRVQRQTAERDLAAGSNRTPGRPNSRHALAGLARCKCGDLMRTKISPYRRKDGTQRREYVCRHVAECDGTCDAPRVDAELVDRQVISHLRGFFLDFHASQAAVIERAETRRQLLAARVEERRAQLAEIAKRERAVADRYARAVTEADELSERAARLALEQLRPERETAAAAVANAERQLGDDAEQTDPADRLLDRYNRLAHAVRGGLDEAGSLLEVNQLLREHFACFDIDTQDDGQIVVVPHVTPPLAEKPAREFNAALRNVSYTLADGDEFDFAVRPTGDEPLDPGGDGADLVLAKSAHPQE